MSASPTVYAGSASTRHRIAVLRDGKLQQVDEPQTLYERLLMQGLAVRPVRGGIRITIRGEPDDDRLLEALQSSL